jgi:ABC-type sugar transport system ATPase subunit
VALVSFSEVSKRFRDVVALDGLTLDVEDGEFVVLLGPSGSGKTTALRLLAGLDEVSAGTIAIGSELVQHRHPKDRDIAMVFQDYALYPQMSVKDNLSFGLRMRHIKRAIIQERVQRVADTLGLADLLKRKPAELSGGQKQRVALGRALVRDPAVFLMDEPLSNLDAKLRTEMRGVIRGLQQEFGTTTLFVTHDQVEAMTMGDRIALLNKGALEQVGTPDDLYKRPANLFVASFVGSPAMNLVDFSANGSRSYIRLTRSEIECRIATQEPRSLPAEVVLGVRPEHTRPWENGRELVGPFSGVVELVEELGRERFIYVLLTEDVRVVVLGNDAASERIGESVEIGFERIGLQVFDPGDGKRLGQLLNPETDRAIRKE